MTEPKPPAKGPVLDAIEHCDKKDPEVMKQLNQIAAMAEDNEIAAAADKAYLKSIGSTLAGLRPKPSD